jgi:hypothetical protein
LTETEISGLEERELDVLILDDSNDKTGSVESVGKEKKGAEIQERMRQTLVLSESLVNLFPSELES